MADTSQLVDAPEQAGTSATPADSSQFSVTQYLQAHPDILQNFLNDPGYASFYGSLAKYAIADAQSHGTPTEQQAIQSGSLAADASQDDNTLLPALGYVQQGGDTTGSQPIEQNLLTQALPTIQHEISDDAPRRVIADQLSGQVAGAATAANDLLAQTQGGHFDGATYFANYPDVAAAYQQQGGQAGTGMTVDQYAQQHYLTNGQREGRTPTYVQDPKLAQDFANADTTTKANIDASNAQLQTNLGALTTATTALQGNLTGDLAAKAAALNTQIASLNDNLATLDASQKAALTQQIATQQADLEQSITTQRQALQDQITALGNAADAQSQAKLASLQTEIAGLNAAQAPLNAARSAAANMQATAVNTGLQRTQDQLTAQNALAGYVGGSTGQDAALARATIDARQQAAQAIGSANTANASDTRDIGVQGAAGQKSIADALADAQAGIAAQGATGNAALTTNLATGRQALGDTGAGALASITANTAASKAGIGALGANTTYANTAAGADQSKSIADALAQGTYGLTSTNAANTLASQQAGNAAKATYYDNDYARSLAAASAVPTIAANTTSALTGLAGLGSAGLNSALNTLNWWSTNTAPAPTPGAIATTPSTAGNSLSTLGTGLTSAALSAAGKNNWWTTPTTPAPVSTTSPGSSYLTGESG